jgi:hypothetical protein
MSNPFEDLADHGMTAPVKAKIRAAEKRAAMKPTAQEQESIDKRRLLRTHSRWRRRQIKEHLARPYWVEFRELAAFLRKMTINDADRLVDFVKRATWLKSGPYAARFCALMLVGDTIARLRIRNGLPPFDDSLPGEEPTAFEKIRDELDCFKTEPTACP